MRRIISFKLAGNILLIGYALLAIFHALVLTQIVPSDIVWGGQISGSQTNLRTLETVSLIITFLFAIVVAAKVDYIKASKYKKVINILLWIIFAYSILNTVGNLVSGISVENLIMAPITIILAFLVFRLAIEK